jgi:cysteine synthase
MVRAAEAAGELRKGRCVVTVLCDTGFRYFSVDGFIN